MLPMLPSIWEVLLLSFFVGKLYVQSTTIILRKILHVLLGQSGVQFLFGTVHTQHQVTKHYALNYLEPGQFDLSISILEFVVIPFINQRESKRIDGKDSYAPYFRCMLVYIRFLQHMDGLLTMFVEVIAPLTHKFVCWEQFSQPS